MGLGLDRNQLCQQILRRVSRWWLPAMMIVASGVFEAFGDGGRAWLQYDRIAILDAELWRLVTGHFVHLGPGHYALNAIAVFLVWVAVGEYLSSPQWLVATAVTIAGVNAGLWLFNPEIVWYVGMSGFLHGLLVAGIVLGFQFLPREALLGGMVVASKIIYEQMLGPMPGSEQSAGGNVVVDAHLYGALAGLAIAAVFWKKKNGD